MSVLVSLVLSRAHCPGPNELTGSRVRCSRTWATCSSSRSPAAESSRQTSAQVRANTPPMCALNARPCVWMPNATLETPGQLRGT
eukprot:1411602-Rhodomonas_salina.1